MIAAVSFGRANNLLTAIRGGGHNVGGRALCDDGLVIDWKISQPAQNDITIMQVPS